MICETIKRYRKAKGMSQEELAVKLNVVRQTVSKWENGLSVPDADILIRMAQLLDVSVSQLLELEPDCAIDVDLAAELEKANELLAEKSRRENLLRQANSKRGAILFLSFLSMLLALSVEHEAVSVFLAGSCTLAAVVILLRNLALLTSVTTDDLRLGVLRTVTWFNLGIFILAMAVAGLEAAGKLTLSQDSRRLLALALVSCVMLFTGFISPKLPYNRHTGLRLPWTVQDEDTWNLAHQILGILSFPTVLLYVACALTISDFEAVTLCAMAVWIGIPGLISFIFFHKKLRGK